MESEAQPDGYGSGDLYGSGTIASNNAYSWASNWQSPYAWATSLVQATNPTGMGVCNSNNNPQPPWTGNSGTITAWLKGSPGSFYSVDVAVMVDMSQVGNTVNANGDPVYAVKASVTDYTWSGYPRTNCGHSTQVSVPDAVYLDSWTCLVEAAKQNQYYPDGTLSAKKGEAKIVDIRPTFGAQATAAWTANFSGTIEIHSAT